MDDFIGETITVQRAPGSPRPVRFTRRGEVHEVAEILHERVDIGHGQLPPHLHKWYNRRHRRYYVVRDTRDRIFEIYLDYSNRSRQTWLLVKRLTRFP